MTKSKSANLPETMDQSPADIQPRRFEDLGLKPTLVKAVAALGFTSPTAIQSSAIPLVLEGRDLVGLAHTGSGKTAAFVLPMLHQLQHDRSVEALILTPTRELALQIVAEIGRLGQFEQENLGDDRDRESSKSRRDPIEAALVVGGKPYKQQLDSLNGKAQIAVATPGRLMDLMQSGRLKRFAPKMVVLDEADEMLDMGFIDEIREIFEMLPEPRHTLMFSATMPHQIKKLISDLMTDPVFVEGERGEANKPDISQYLVGVKPKEKLAALLRLIDFYEPEKAIVFCRTRVDTDEVCKFLQAHGVMAAALHGDLGQNTRTEIVSGFRTSHFKVMVATDVASRGLDFSNVSHVFNFHIPENLERYTHRIGRTGRAGNKGQALTLTGPGDLRNHRFFRQVSPDDFQVMQVPTRHAVKNQRLESLMKEISALEMSEEAEAMGMEYGMHPGDCDINLKLLTYVLNQQRVIGPETIGFASKELSSFFKKTQMRPARGLDKRQRHRGSFSRMRQRDRGPEEGRGRGGRERRRSGSR